LLGSTFLFRLLILEQDADTTQKPFTGHPNGESHRALLISAIFWHLIMNNNFLLPPRAYPFRQNKSSSVAEGREPRAWPHGGPRWVLFSFFLLCFFLLLFFSISFCVLFSLFIYKCFFCFSFSFSIFSSCFSFYLYFLSNIIFPFSFFLFYSSLLFYFLFNLYFSFLFIYSFFTFYFIFFIFHIFHF
jgi:hypothetical protein